MDHTSQVDVRTVYRNYIYIDNSFLLNNLDGLGFKFSINSLGRFPFVSLIVFKFSSHDKYLILLEHFLYSKPFQCVTIQTNLTL